MKYILGIILFVSVGVNAQICNKKSLPMRRTVYAEFAGASMLVGINLTHVLQTENVDNIFILCYYYCCIYVF